MFKRSGGARDIKVAGRNRKRRWPRRVQYLELRNQNSFLQRREVRAALSESSGTRVIFIDGSIRLPLSGGSGWPVVKANGGE